MDTSDELRGAVARLTPEERAALISRWRENGERWAPSSPPLSRVWTLLADLVAEVDGMERVRTTGLAHAERRDGGPEPRTTIRPAGRARA